MLKLSQVFALLLAMCCVLPSAALALENPFRVEGGSVELAAGASGKLRLTLVVPAGFHVYRDMIQVELSDGAGQDFGEASLPQGVSKPDPASPTETREMYELDVIIEVPVTAGAEAGVNTATFSVGYQGCKDSLCYMPKTEQVQADVVVTATAAADAAAQAESALVSTAGGGAPEFDPANPPDPVHISVGEATAGSVRIHVEIDEGWHANRSFMTVGFPYEDPKKQAETWTLGEAQMPAGTEWSDPSTGMVRWDLEGSFDIDVPVSGPEGRHELDIEVGYQACIDTLCLIPRYEIYQAVVQLGDAPAAAPALVAPAEGDSLAKARDKGTLPLMLLVFGAGFLVSLTPCVLPMVPITIGIIGARSAGSRMKGLSLAATYVAGMAFVYTSLGVAAGFTGMMFGSWLQNPFVVGSIGAFFFFMGLAMFGLFDVGMPSSLQTKLNRFGGAGYSGAAIVGMVGALVAGPCSGPVLLSIIALIGKEGEIALGATLMMVFSLGMGLIFLVAGVFSTTLLKPGAWMDTVKKSFGLIMWAGALYFVAPQLSDTMTAAVACAMCLVTAVFVWPSEGEGFWIARTRKLYTVVVGIVGLYLLLGLLISRGFILPAVDLAARVGAGSTDAAEVGVEWLHDEAEALAQAAAEGKPVMIDFTADWCAACKELEHLTYPDARIVAASAGFVPVMIDATRSDDPIVNALLKKYDVGGLPMIHFLRPDGSLIEGNSVSGFKTADDFLPHMEHALAVVAG